MEGAHAHGLNESAGAIVRDDLALEVCDHAEAITRAALDAAMAAAYGWADWRADLPDDEILRRQRSSSMPNFFAALASKVITRALRASASATMRQSCRSTLPLR
jgi:hypothetical protein